MLTQWGQHALRFEAVGDLIGDYNGDIMSPCKITEVRTQPGDLCTAFGERMCRLAAFLKFCAIVGSDTVNDDDADIETLDCHRNLVLENMLLGFEVVDASALYASQSGFLIWWQIGQFWVALENLT